MKIASQKKITFLRKRSFYGILLLKIRFFLTIRRYDVAELIWRVEVFHCGKTVAIAFLVMGSNLYADPQRNPSYFGQHELCESEIIRAEQKYKIPHRLFLAIGTVESGRALDNTKNKRPWPWTICANGKSYYCSTKNAAIASVKRLMARGIRNIDVGCMQVNLVHHSKAFRTLEEAFTPRNNVD